MLSIKTECLEHFIPIGEKFLRKAVSEYAEHYHTERNHQGLENEIIIPSPEVGSSTGEVQRKKRLGGMLNYYYRETA